ncbi:BrnA antitoxin family protein [Pseudoduganella sp. OTU4001]|uniref:BrnA antitoxin family protein n=1 Tax=Pseudoduganella sp. OTU4001 TaxID=3043854 RepID=UPI00313E177A
MKANKTSKDDAELLAFEDALLRSVDQALRAEGTIHAPDEIKARRGRPAGSTKPDKKIPTTIRLDPDVLHALKASGRGWQSRVNEAIRDWLKARSEL